MDKRKSLLVIAGSVLLTGGILHSTAAAGTALGCYTNKGCNYEGYPGYCALAWNGHYFCYCALYCPDCGVGTWQCSALPPPPQLPDEK